MNVMNRPLFRALGGGAEKFPDLSGDGRVTQKDILIGRGVIEKQEGCAGSFLKSTFNFNSGLMFGDKLELSGTFVR